MSGGLFFMPSPLHPHPARSNAMSLKDQITEDMKAAMRARDSERLGTIRLLLSAVKQKEVDERVVLDDVAMVAIIDKLIKQRKDSARRLPAGPAAGPGRQGVSRNHRAAGLPAPAPERRGGHRRRSGHRGGARRQGPGRHGQGDGCGQNPAGRQGRHGAGVQRGQGSAWRAEVASGSPASRCSDRSAVRWHVEGAQQGLVLGDARRLSAP